MRKTEYDATGSKTQVISFYDSAEGLTSQIRAMAITAKKRALQCKDFRKTLRQEKKSSSYSMQSLEVYQAPKP